jgi:hypothetical protein
MSTDDQHASALTGEALLAAGHDGRLGPLRDRLAEATDNPKVRAEVAGRMAAEWLADPGPDLANRLIAVGLLLTSGGVDYDRLGEVVREAVDRAQALGRVTP